MNKGNLHIRTFSCCLLVFICFQAFSLKAQVPGTCFEIESILVDGCDGSLEGQNEMLRFVVGNTSLNTANLSVTWPSNAWLGICQNATTTAAVAQINATITNCGYLKEPTAGILPAGAKVILVTSTAFNPLAQSFANLSDTLYILFQCAGNTGGHFKNYNTTAPLTRTLTIAFSSPMACSDAVTYNTSLLTMQNGSVGGQDGATVEFTWGGAATYVNFGCQAPFIPLTVNAGMNAAIACGGGFAALQAAVTGTASGFIWQGGNGTFSQPDSLSTTYTPAASESGNVVLAFGAINLCNDTIFDSVTLAINSVSDPVTAPVSYCLGAASAALTASGGNLLWYATPAGGLGSSIAPTPSTTVAGTTDYYVSQTINGCESGRSIITVTINSLPDANAGMDQNIPCGATTLTLNGSTNTLNTTTNWIGPGIVSNGNTLNPTINAAGTYFLTVADQNSCTAIDSVIVSQASLLSASTTVTSVSCFGGNDGTATVTPTGGTPPYLFSWSPSGGNNANASSLIAGIYTVTITDNNFCSIMASASIDQPNDVLAATITNTASSCGQNNGTATVTVTGGTLPYNYSWAPYGGNAANVSGLAQGNYTVTITDARTCTMMANTSIANSSSVNASISLTPINCFGATDGTATINISGGSAPYSIIWNTGETSATLSDLSEGNYCVKVVDAGGCIDSVCEFLSNPPLLNADFTSNLIVTDIYNSEIHFTNQSSPEANNWIWNFGDTTFSSDQAPIHTYELIGIYPVTLVVSNSQGCTDTVIHEIIITDGFTFYAPNTFTPDGNGNNEYFLPKGTGWDPQNFQMQIFDRWGNLCFTTSDPYKGWDGKANKGTEQAQVDTYIWKVQVKDTARNMHYLLGTIMMLK